jgi:hypothetical protein
MDYSISDLQKNEPWVMLDSLQELLDEDATDSSGGTGAIQRDIDGVRSLAYPENSFAA